MIKSIYNGEVSDHPKVPLYYKVGFDKKAGLPLYRCSRGTNSLEGGIFANIVRAIGASGAGAEMADCFLAEYHLRHNIKVRYLVCFFIMFALIFFLSVHCVNSYFHGYIIVQKKNRLAV